MLIMIACSGTLMRCENNSILAVSFILDTTSSGVMGSRLYASIFLGPVGIMSSVGHNLRRWNGIVHRSFCTIGKFLSEELCKMVCYSLPINYHEIANSYQHHYDCSNAILFISIFVDFLVANIVFLFFCLFFDSGTFHVRINPVFSWFRWRSSFIISDKGKIYQEI